MELGAKVYFYEGGFHHSKIMMVDSCYSFIGSANLNSRSLNFDYECNLLICDPPTTGALQSIFEHDKQTRCFKLTPEIWKQFPLRKRIMGKIFSILSPLV
ncbi:phospholipase D domain protein [gut metagenome]|uniref:Phospholipase D domain protein n=1 Tax=gut metagenome TaxID=749906 RepID=J9G6Z3_9ZZZZ